MVGIDLPGWCIFRASGAISVGFPRWSLASSGLRRCRDTSAGSARTKKGWGRVGLAVRTTYVKGLRASCREC